PRPHQQEDQRQRRDLGHEADRALVELGRGHEQRGEQADDERGADERRAHRHRGRQRLAPDVEEGVGAHSIPRKSDATTRRQPSTVTKTRSLTGSEMLAGGSMTMPMLDSVVATTRSMTRNGSRMSSPIWNAVWSSETTNDGMAILSGTSSARFGRAVSLTS